MGSSRAGWFCLRVSLEVTVKMWARVAAKEPICKGTHSWLWLWLPVRGLSLFQAGSRRPQLPTTWPLRRANAKGTLHPSQVKESGNKGIGAGVGELGSFRRNRTKNLWSFILLRIKRHFLLNRLAEYVCSSFKLL